MKVYTFFLDEDDAADLLWLVSGNNAYTEMADDLTAQMNAQREVE